MKGLVEVESDPAYKMINDISTVGSSHNTIGQYGSFQEHTFILSVAAGTPFDTNRR